MLSRIKDNYIADRTASIDLDFLEFEETMVSKDDQELLCFLLDEQYSEMPNPHNSILMYCTGLSNDFDHVKARANTKGGSPPDVDMDFEALGRESVVDKVIERWGRDNVANIITHGTFKPKSLTRRFFKIVEGNTQTMSDVLLAIPKAHGGKEATIKEIIEGDEDKGYKPHPDLATNPRYKPWYDFANQLEGMVANFGIHPAGLVISDFPIYEQIPMWKNGKSERITQYDMHECESLGLTNQNDMV